MSISLSFSDTYTHTCSSLPDPNYAGHCYNHITEASCYCCSLRCPKTHNWIEEFMVFCLSLGLTVSPHLQTGNLSSKSSLIYPSSTPGLFGYKQQSGGIESAIFKLTSLHLSHPLLRQPCVEPAFQIVQESATIT